MTGPLSTRRLIAIAVAIVAVAVGFASYTQRNASRDATEQVATAQALLTGMLDQETGVRGFAITRDESFLGPFLRGRVDYDAALARASRLVSEDTAAGGALRDADAKAQAWRRMAELEIVLLRRGDRAAALAGSEMRRRKAAMDGFRAGNARYSRLVKRRSDQLETRAAIISVLLVVGLGTLFAGAGAWLSRRVRSTREAAQAAEDAFLARQRDLNLGLQVTESEEEAHGFLQRHLQASIEGSEVVVLKRNNSANRLLPGTRLAPDSKLRDVLVDAEPRSCLAVRLAQRRSQAPDGADSVLTCSICSKLGTETACSPLLVGGEVIGSVLVGHPDPLPAAGERAIEESVKQAAPVLANLRNLAIAENRAATDGLTGLPNRRSFEENLRRMVAHANRSMSPLAAVALDLDHFKQINDVYGHARGDEVLAEVGALLKSLLRDSDLVARVGGEEFTLLLPDTGRDGAIVICERVRASIAALEFPAMAEGVTASLGIATLPEDGSEGAALVRTADRMLYAAKDLGRNRVEITELALGPVPDEVAG